MATKLTITVNRANKTIRYTGLPSYKEDVHLEIIGIQDLNPNNLTLSFFTKSKAQAVVAQGFTLEGDLMLGSVPLRSDVLEQAFSTVKTGSALAFSIILWDYVDDTVIFNGQVNIQNNPYDETLEPYPLPIVKKFQCQYSADGTIWSDEVVERTLFIRMSSDSGVSFGAPIELLVGEKGDDGDSAYQVWLNDGHEGSVQDFFDDCAGMTEQQKSDLNDSASHILNSDIHVTIENKSSWDSKSEFSGAYSDLSEKPALFSGSYADLDGKPALFTWSYSDLTNKPSLFDGTWITLSGKPEFANIATTGSYTDLSNKPSLFSGDYSDLANRPSLFDGTWTSLSGKPSLSVVATSGSYSDLADRPVLPSGYFSGSYTDLSSKPSLFSGSYIDLTNKPSFTATAVGLGNVSNDAQVRRSEMGVVSGVATLDVSGNVAQNISASKIQGMISIDNIPSGALERLVRTPSDNTRFALTSSDVQVGDTVKVTATGSMYMVIDASHLGSELGYEPYTASAASSVPWSGITSKPAFFSGVYSDLANKPDLSVYSLSTHNHAGVYSIASHAHDYSASFSAISHNHNGVYSTLSHTHTGVYSAVGHAHSDYSLNSHNHDLTYSAWAHNHSGVYAVVSHTHDYSGVYAPLTHSHVISYTDLTNQPNLASIATSGSYADLIDAPVLPSGYFSGRYEDLSSKPTLFNGDYDSLTSKPTLFSWSYADLTEKPSLFSGSYTDLTNKPTFSASAVGLGSVTNDSQVKRSEMGSNSGVATLGADGKLVQNIPAGNISGTISVDNLPPSALERLTRVTDDTARFALTSTQVQAGDTVKVTSSGLMYMVINTASLTSESGYEPYTASAASSVPWSGVTSKPSFFSGNYTDLANKPDLTSYALTTHNHSGIYSLTSHAHDYSASFSAMGHNHLGVYSPLGHNHSGVYAATVHTHGDYSSTGHTHTEYSLTVHNHDSAYSATSHNHSGTYSLTNHTHDYTGVFAAIGHDHAGVYSGVGHDHASVYAVVSHAHANYSETTHGHSYTSLTDKPSLFSGNYDDLSNKPVLPSGVFDGNYDSLYNKPIIPSGVFSGSYGDLADKPDYSLVYAPYSHTHTVSYNNLTDKPALPSGYFSGSYNDLTDTPTSFGGSWNNLSDKPTTFPPETHTHTVSDIEDFPVIPSGTFSGSYDDLTDKPILPSGVFSGDYEDLSNKPDLSVFPVLTDGLLSPSVIPGGAGGGSVDMTWAQVTASSITAETNHGYCADTTTNDMTLTFGATPTLGDTVGVRRMNDTHVFTLAGNGNNLNGQPENINVDTFDDFLVEFVGGDIGWMMSYNFSFSESIVSYNNLTNKPDLSLFATDAEIATLQPKASNRNAKGNISGSVEINASLGDYQTCTTTATVTNIIVSNLALETGMVLSLDNTGGYSISFNASEILTTDNNGSYACAFFNDNGTIRLMGKSRII